ncbi:hypothetical protein [Actinomadura kijaniata]|uniref:hypothetical protein n=1 Tax=Actinomadura kijaniata TaxID=46161 RepID=UPI00082A98C8|nr:hypothetical protein [Actinomadura kijaniata]
MLALGNREDLTEALGDLNPTLAVLDGITEAVSLHGLELKDNTDIATFGLILPRRIASQGPAVTTLDHVVKDRDGCGRYAIGGVHKLNIINGAAYTMENREPFGTGITGRSGLYIAKDRPGQLRRHAVHSAGGMRWFADLKLASHPKGFVEAELEAPNAGDRKPFRPTALMAKISDALAREPVADQDRDL